MHQTSNVDYSFFIQKFPLSSQRVQLEITLVKKELTSEPLEGGAGVVVGAVTYSEIRLGP